MLLVLLGPAALAIRDRRPLGASAAEKRAMRFAPSVEGCLAGMWNLRIHVEGNGFEVPADMRAILAAADAAKSVDRSDAHARMLEAVRQGDADAALAASAEACVPIAIDMDVTFTDIWSVMMTTRLGTVNQT